MVLTFPLTYLNYQNTSGQYILSNVSRTGFTTVTPIQSATTTTSVDATGNSVTVEGGNVSIIKSDDTIEIIFLILLLLH